MIVVAYDGTEFQGWQRLGGGARTVQKTLEDVLSRALGGGINVVGSGRTDAGVHADGQAANFWTASSLPLDAIVGRLNDELPRDVVCVSAHEMVPSFHARYRAVAKTYAYRFHDGPVRDPFLVRWTHHVPARLDGPAMIAACGVLTGTHDFSALCNAKEDAQHFVRNLTFVHVERRGDMVEVAFTADGFLYNQARVMAACALEAGLGRMSPAQLAGMVASHDRSLTPGALGAYGLRLVGVEYRADDFAGPPSDERLPRADGPPPGQAREACFGAGTGAARPEGAREPRDSRAGRGPRP